MSRLITWPSMMLLGWAETKLWTLKYGSKSIQTSLILRQCPPKPYKLLKFFISFVTTVKSRHAPTIWKKLRWKSLCLPILKSITEIMKTFKSLYGFEGSCLKLRDVCMDFERYFKVHNLVSVHPKSVILGQMINLDMIFHVVVSVYRLVKTWNSLQFPVEFRNGLYKMLPWDCLVPFTSIMYRTPNARQSWNWVGGSLVTVSSLMTRQMPESVYAECLFLRTENNVENCTRETKCDHFSSHSTGGNTWSGTQEQHASTCTWAETFFFTFVQFWSFFCSLKKNDSWIWTLKV